MLGCQTILVRRKKPSKNDPTIEKKPSSFSNPFEKIFDEVNKVKEGVSDNNEEIILKEEIIKPTDQTNEIEKEKVIHKVDEEERLMFLLIREIKLRKQIKLLRQKPQ